jgi:hypothetical protein
MQGLVYRKDLLSEWVHVKIAEDLITFGGFTATCHQDGGAPYKISLHNNPGVVIL